MHIHFETPNLVARNLNASDVTQEFAHWFNKPNTLIGLQLPGPHISLDQLHALVNGFAHSSQALIALTARSNDKILGIYHLKLFTQHRTATWMFGADSHHLPEPELMIDSCGFLCDYLFQNGLVDKVSAHIVSSHPELVEALKQRSPFIYEATLRQEILTHQGKRLDTSILSCFKPHAVHAKSTP